MQGLAEPKLKKRERRTVAARGKAKNAKRNAARTTPAAADSNALAELLLAQTLAGACVTNDAAQAPAFTASVGLESLLNPTSLRLRQVAKQPKYNGNLGCWPQCQPEFKLWVKTEKLHEDRFRMALFDCLEGPPANMLL